MKHKGFTLIELLIVVAIIGILASIVIGALSSAKAKAQDTKIKASLGNMRSQAALYFTENGDYGDPSDNDCDTGMFAETKMAELIASTEEANGGVDAVCYAYDSIGGVGADTWAVSVALLSDDTVIWCADSNGFGGAGVAQVVDDSAVCQ